MHVDSAADTPVLPRECTIGFGIPTSKISFDKARYDDNHDFAHHFLGGWEQYNQQLIADFDQFAGAVTPLGVTLLRELTLSDFGSQLKTDDARIFILFSHWTDDLVEFHDGLAHYSKVVSQVPSDYAGILDLCVCHPVALVDDLLSARPSSLIRYIPRKAKPSYWFSYYKALFNLLGGGDMSYPAAMEALTIGLLKSASPKGKA